MDSLGALWAFTTAAACISAVFAAAEASRRLHRMVRRGAALRRQFKGPPPSSLLLGNLPETSWVPLLHRVALDWTNQYGLLYYLRLSWLDVLVIADPVIVAEVLHARDFDKVPEMYGGVSQMMSEGGKHPDLVSGLTDSSWRLFRKGLAPAFSPANIRAGFKYTAAACSELVTVLERQAPNESVDIDEACLCETMDVISGFAFGADFGAVKRFGRGEVSRLTDVLQRAETEVERRLNDITRKFIWWMTSEGRRAYKTFSDFQGIMAGLLADMRQRKGNNPPETDQSLGAYMLRLRDPDSGRPLLDERLLPNIGMFFFAGSDTTAHTMAWTLFYIATHPEVEAKIVAELAAAGLLATPQQLRPRPPGYDDLASLTYLGAAMKESMRMTPVVGSGTVRVCQKDCTLGGGRIFVPAGTALWTPLVAIHNNDAVWEEPDTYRPERWLEPGADYLQPAAAADGGSKQQQPAGVSCGGDDAPGSDGGSKPGATGQGAEAASGGRARSYEMNISRSKDGAKVKRFLPFSDGHRDCIGQALAKMNYTAVLATLLSRFHFDLAPEMGGYEGVRAKENMAMTLQPGDGLRMLCRPRI